MVIMGVHAHGACETSPLFLTGILVLNSKLLSETEMSGKKGGAVCGCSVKMSALNCSVILSASLASFSSLFFPGF
jgi:hypothetical protein